MNTTINCPKCNEPLDIPTVLAEQSQKAAKLELDAKYKIELEREKKLAAEQAKEEMSLLFRNKENEANEAKEKNQKYQEDLLEQAKLIRILKEKDQERDLEMQKKLSEEEEKIRLDAAKKAEEEQHLKILEKDKQLQDAIKANEELRRKLHQGSQQTQGEAFEQEFEQILRREFPNDIISEVAKGVRGGDIIQEVWDRNGNNCGKILWELKNTKTWSEQWIDKLKADQRSVTAEWAVVISEAVPSTVDNAKYYKNVWVTKRNFVIGLACALRMNLIQLEMARQANKGKKEKVDVLYSYFSGTEFRLRVEAIVESFSNMQVEIEKEKRYFSNKWARDEKNIRQAIDNTYGMHGDLKGIMGNTLQQIKGIETLEIEDGK